VLSGDPSIIPGASNPVMSMLRLSAGARRRCCILPFDSVAENTRRKNYDKKSQSAHHRTTLLGYIFASEACIDSQKKNLLNGNISSICFHNMVKFGLLMAEICWRVWGTSAYFNGFCVLASLLHRRCSTEVSQTLHDVWPSPALVYHTYVFRGSCPLTEFFQLQNSLCAQVLRSPILAALLHGT